MRDNYARAQASYDARSECDGREAECPECGTTCPTDHVEGCELADVEEDYWDRV